MPRSTAVKKPSKSSRTTRSVKRRTTGPTHKEPESANSRGTIRYRSRTELNHWPLLEVALGPDRSNGHVPGNARALIAIGDRATGVIAVGGVARGVLAVGGVSCGLISIGGVTLGVLAAVGGVAMGGLVLGGIAAGVLARGGVAIGLHTRGHVNIQPTGVTVHGRQLLARH